MEFVYTRNRVSFGKNIRRYSVASPPLKNIPPPRQFPWLVFCQSNFVDLCLNRLYDQNDISCFILFSGQVNKHVSLVRNVMGAGWQSQA